jgi:hypothetical protein
MKMSFTEPSRRSASSRAVPEAPSRDVRRRLVGRAVAAAALLAVTVGCMTLAWRTIYATWMEPTGPTFAMAGERARSPTALGRRSDAQSLVTYRGDRVLLWASGSEADGDAAYFDVTRATAPISHLRHSLVRLTADTRPHTREAPIDDPAVSRYALTDADEVFGTTFDGRARAWPAASLAARTIVNSRVDAVSIALFESSSARVARVIRSERDGAAIRLEHSGYSLNDRPVYFDHASRTLWTESADGNLVGIAGPRCGATLPLIATAERMPLADWRNKHPGTVMMLPAG